MTGKKLIILAAGNGTRLGPITAGGYPKPLAHVFDKPCIYYSIAAAIAAGYTDVAIIIKPGTHDLFYAHFEDGSMLGINLEYIEQPEQRGIADAFIVAKDFIGTDGVTLVLGDNIFIGESFTRAMIEASNTEGPATVFVYKVPLKEASKYGVAEYRNGLILSIEEKPEKPKSSYIIPGVYFYDNSVIEVAENLEMSPRDELEISGVNQHYLDLGILRGVELSKDVTWADTGTATSQQDAGESVRRWEEERGSVIGSPEVEAFKAGLITAEQFAALIQRPGIVKSEYGDYLQQELEAYLGK